jgi:hypothetical protein
MKLVPAVPVAPTMPVEPTPNGDGWTGVLPLGHQAPPRGAEKITLHEAWQRMRRYWRGPGSPPTKRAMQLTWCPRWEKQGLAVDENRGTGKKRRWLVWTHAHPAITVPFSDKSCNYDDTVLTGWQGRILHWKRAMIVAAADVRANARRRGEREHDALKAWLNAVATVCGHALMPPPQAKVPTVRTLTTWERVYDRGDDDGRIGLAALVDERWERAIDDAAADDDEQADPYLEELVRLYQTDRGRTIGHTHRRVELIAQQEGWQRRSYSTARRQLLRRLPEAARTLARRGGKAYEDLHEPHVRRDYTTITADAIWNSDHKRLDVFVKNDKGQNVRPWLTAWTDVRSRRVLGTYVSCDDPNQLAILLAFRDAVRNASGRLPDAVYIDNGKDYDAVALTGVTKAQRQAMRGSDEPANVDPEAA